MQNRESVSFPPYSLIIILKIVMKSLLRKHNCIGCKASDLLERGKEKEVQLSASKGTKRVEVRTRDDRVKVAVGAS